MDIAVVIPVYNRTALLVRAVQSVMAQTLGPAEIVVVDDGSLDDPAAALARFSDPRLRVLRQENRGVAAARNTGIGAAKAAWLAFLDSDDYWLPAKLERQQAWHQANPWALISQTDEIWMRNGRRVNPRRRHLKQGGDIFARSLELCLISPSAVMIDRRLFDEIGLFDPRLPACEDYDLWLRVTCRYPVGLVEEKLVVKTGGHDDQLSNQWGLDKFRVAALEGLLQNHPLTAEQRLAAEAEMARKLAILRAGAEKRNNADLTRWCASRMSADGSVESGGRGG